MSASLFRAGSDLAEFLQRLPGEQAGATRANSSTDGRDHAQAQLLQGPRAGGGAVDVLDPVAIVTSVSRCSVSVAPEHPSPSSPKGSQPTTVASFTTSWK